MKNRHDKEVRGLKRECCFGRSLVLLFIFAGLWNTFGMAVWTGAGHDGDWSNDANWDGGTAPIATADARLPGGLSTTYPSIESTVSIADLSIETGASLTVTSSGHLQIRGDLQNSGTCTASGAVTFDGTAAQQISGTAAARFNTLNINNSDAVVSADVDMDVTGTMTVHAGSVFHPAAGVVINSAGKAGSLAGSGTVNVTRVAAGTADLVNQYQFSSTTLDDMTVDYTGAGNQNINRFVYGSIKTGGSGTKTFISSPGSETRVHQACRVGEGTTVSAASLLIKMDGENGALIVNGTLDFTSSSGRIRCESGTTTLTLGLAGLIRTVDGDGLGPAGSGNPSLQTSGGTWDLSALSSAGTVEYYRSGDQPVTARTYHHLVLSGSGKRIVSAGTDVQGRLLISNSAKLVLNETGQTSLGVGLDAAFGADSTFVVGVGTDSTCDQLDVVGALTLNGATLELGALDGAGRTIAFASAISGTFDGLADGTVLDAPNGDYFIHYETDRIVINKTAGTTSSGIDLRAYQAADGIYVEFMAHDVESDGTIQLTLLDDADVPVWTGSVDATAGPQLIARFRVPGLEAGHSYNFRVRDEVGQSWEASGVTVGGFNAEMTSASLAGITLTFDSLPEREYEIQWTAALDDTWHTVRTVTATGETTRVEVDYPDSADRSGFFRIQLR